MVMTGATGIPALSLQHASCRASELQSASTEKAARAAELSAEVAQAQLNPVLWPRIAAQRIGWPTVEGGTKLSEAPGIKLEFENLGGTDAILEKVQFAFRLAAEPPQETPIKSALLANRVVQSGSKSESFESKPMTLTGEEMSAMQKQDTFLWLYGLVAFADVRGTQWETEFCFRYNGAQKILEPYPRTRNKCTRRQAT
jgi:hypothetical protein